MLTKRLMFIESGKLTDTLPSKRNNRDKPTPIELKNRLKDIAVHVYRLVKSDIQLTLTDISTLLYDTDSRRIREVLCVLDCLGLYNKSKKHVKRKGATSLSEVVEKVHSVVQNSGPITKRQIVQQTAIDKRRVTNVLIIMLAIGQYRLVDGQYRYIY